MIFSLKPWGCSMSDDLPNTPSTGPSAPAAGASGAPMPTPSLRRSLKTATMPPETAGHHATVDLTDDRTLTAEVGGRRDTLTWAAYVKKVLRGPWSSGATFKW